MTLFQLLKELSDVNITIDNYSDTAATGKAHVGAKEVSLFYSPYGDNPHIIIRCEQFSHMILETITPGSSIMSNFKRNLLEHKNRQIKEIFGD